MVHKQKNTENNTKTFNNKFLHLSWSKKKAETDEKYNILPSSSPGRELDPSSFGGSSSPSFPAVAPLRLWVGWWVSGWVFGRLCGEYRGVRSFRFCEKFSFFFHVFFFVDSFCIWFEVFSFWLLRKFLKAKN